MELHITGKARHGVASIDFIQHRGHKVPFAFQIFFCRISAILAISRILSLKQQSAYQTRMYMIQQDLFGMKYYDL